MGALDESQFVGRLSILYCSHWRNPQEAWLDHLSSHGVGKGRMSGDTGPRPGEGISSGGLHEDLAEPGTEPKAAAAPVQVFCTEEALSGKEVSPAHPPASSVTLLGMQHFDLWVISNYLLSSLEAEALKIEI